MTLTSGTHPELYKMGVKIGRVSPTLFEYGWKALTVPGEVYEQSKLMLGDKGKAGKIKMVDIEMTIVCNLRCWFCWWWGTEGIAFKLVKDRDPLVTQELSTQEIFNIVDQVTKDNTPAFYLSGGEPFLRKDTVDVIEYMNNKGSSITLNNNGTLLTEEKLQRLAKLKKLSINFSIDGPEDVHDKIRGQGNFKRTTDNIRRLIELRGDSQFPSIKTNTTFSPWRVREGEELVETFVKAGQLGDHEVG